MVVKEINDVGGFDVGGKKYKFNIVVLDDKYLFSEVAVNVKCLKVQNNMLMVFMFYFGGVFVIQVFNEQDNFIFGVYISVLNMIECGNKFILCILLFFVGYV